MVAASPQRPRLKRRYLVAVGLVLLAVAGTAAAELGPNTIDFNEATTPAPPAGATLHVIQADGVKNAVVLDTFGNGQQGVWVCRTAEGTGADPEALESNNLMCSMQAWGYDGSSYGPRPAGSVAIRAAGEFTPSSHPSWFKVEVTQRGSTNNILPMIVTPEGHWGHAGPAPTLSGCGAGASVYGDDNGGRVTIGTGGATACTVVFASEWIRTDGVVAETPGCLAQDTTTPVLIQPGATSTELELSGVLLAGDKVVYDCRQLEN